MELQQSLQQRVQRVGTQRTPLWRQKRSCFFLGESLEVKKLLGGETTNQENNGQSVDYDYVYYSYDLATMVILNLRSGFLDS